MQPSTGGSLAISYRFLLLLFIGTLVLGLGLALFAGGGRYGLYSDDYSHKEWAYDEERGQWQPRLELEQPYLRPIGQVIVFNLANALPEWELPLRLWWAFVHIANVLLASVLAYRLVPSPVMLVTTGLFLLLPIQAHEAVFWHSGAASALLGTLVALIAMHLLMKAVRTDRKWGLFAGLGLVVYGLIPQFYEQALACIAVLPLFALVDKPVSRKRLLRALLIIAIAVILVFLHWVLVLRHSPNVASRGGMWPSLVSVLTQGLPETLARIRWIMLDLYGPGGFVSALELGAQSILDAPLTILLTALLVAGAAIALALASRQEKGPPELRSILVLLGTGCVWTAAAFLPGMMIQGQLVESRMLYFPWVGLAFVGAAGSVFLMTRLPYRWSYVLALGLACLLALAAILMAGFGQVYRLRYEHDQRQIEALTEAVPDLPEGWVYMVPISSDERYLPRLTEGPGVLRLERILLGVLETDWSMAGALRMRYGKSDLHVATHSHWAELDFRGYQEQEDGGHVMFGWRSWPAERVVAFSFRDGKVVLHDAIVSERADGSRVRVELPLAREVGAPGAIYEEVVLEESGK